MLIKQMPRQSLFWVFVAQTIIIAPHLTHLPEWIVLTWLLILGWRIQMYRGLWRSPKTIEKVALVALCGVGLLFGYSRLFALEPMVGLLVTAFLLKLLEMQQRKELLLVIFIGFFVTATQFLFSVTLAATAYGVISLLLLLVALVSANQDIRIENSHATVRKAVGLMLQSLPLMLLLFIFIPKLGSLWHVPSLKNIAKTGVSNSMSPGDFSRLGLSNEVAFRVTFDTELPRQSQLYWRGLVFSNFDGRRWSPISDFSQSQSQNEVLWAASNLEARSNDWQMLDIPGRETRYQVMLEASQQSWLYSLPMPTEWGGATGLSRDMTLLSKNPITERLTYELVSTFNFEFEPERLSSLGEFQATQLPLDFNPKTQQLALKWLREEGSAKGLMERILRLYNDKFTYTLQPPMLGRHSVDEFLWTTQKGFCEHFASSFVFFMRSAGVPARVVVGYQGGELNPLDNYLIVRQKDAHAWAEVWFQGQGWVRVDPTAAVAPERIEQSLEASLSSADASLVGGFLGRAGAFGWVKQLQLQWDSSNYRWQLWVLGFDRNRQNDFLKKLLGGLQAWKITLAFISVAALCLAPIILRLLWLQRPPPLSPVARCLLRFERKLKKLGLVRRKGETLGDFAIRAAEQHPNYREQFMMIAKLYERVVYGEDNSGMAALNIRISYLKV
jgi:hypothetical protein|tara:strand:+ start:2443 stop:4452 length:2010 start_codon:yes stop_codon:yes gene_type:complete